MSIVEILAQARALTPDERIELRELLNALIKVDEDKKPKRSLMELSGLGKEIWQGIDTDAYINEMRDEWDRER